MIGHTEESINLTVITQHKPRPQWLLHAFCHNAVIQRSLGELVHPIGTYTKNSRRYQHSSSVMYQIKTYNEGPHLWIGNVSFVLLSCSD